MPVVYPGLGCDTATAEDLEGIGFAEDIDTAHLSNFLRLPSNYSIPNFTEAGNQGSHDNCTGWAVGYGVLGYFYRSIDNDPHFQGSASFIYNQVATRNQGMSIPQGLNLAKEKGVCDSSIMQNDIPYYTQPSPEAIVNGSYHLVSDYYHFKTADIELIKYFTCKNYPVLFDMDVDHEFQMNENSPDMELQTDGKWLWNKLTGKIAGGHAMVICGYDNNVGEAGAFKVLSSWGKSWANNGYVWMDYQFFVDNVPTSIFGPEIYVAYPQRVITKPITKLTNTTAVAGGNILFDEGEEIIERGVCYATSSEPTVTNFVKKSGLGVGSFTANLTNLKPDQLYHLRAYSATSTVTTYGNEITFTTPLNNTGEDGTICEGVDIAGWWNSLDPTIQNALNQQIFHSGTTIPDTAGLKNLFSLTKLDIKNQSLNGELVLPACFSSLTAIYCDTNNLTSIDVEDLPQLVNLYCSSNELTSIKINKAYLKNFSAYNNPLGSTLDLSNAPNLVYVECRKYELTGINLQNTPALTVVLCDSNSLTRLDLSQSPALVRVQCDYNSLTSLNVSGLKNLNHINCEHNKLESLDVSGVDNLIALYCSFNSIASLNVDNLKKLQNAWCSYNKLTNIWASGLTDITMFTCDFNLLTYDPLYKLMQDLPATTELDWGSCSPPLNNVNADNGPDPSNPYQGSDCDKLRNYYAGKFQ